MLKDARTLVLVPAPVLVLVLLSTRTSYARTRPSAMSAALSWLGFATQWVPRRYGRLMTLRSVQCAVGWCMLTKTAGAGTVHAFSTTGGEAITLCVRPVPVPSELVHVWWQPLLTVFAVPLVWGLAGNRQGFFRAGKGFQCMPITVGSVTVHHVHHKKYKRDKIKHRCAIVIDLRSSIPYVLVAICVYSGSRRSWLRRETGNSDSEQRHLRMLFLPVTTLYFQRRDQLFHVPTAGL